MSMTRRKFFGTATTAGLAFSLVPGKASLSSLYTSKSSSIRPDISCCGGPTLMPSVIAMGSGAPLGGIGTGFLELRPDGCFYEWQIFNLGKWANKDGQKRVNNASEPNLQFLLWTAKPETKSQQLRRLYLRPDQNNLYSLSYAQDIQGIEYEAWFPMTTLRYRDETLPVQISATAFSPFMPGKARDSATPGFNMVFTLENISNETVQASLLSVLNNPLVAGLKNRQLKNTVRCDSETASLLFETDAQTEEKSDVGSLCLSVKGGEPSWISGTFNQYSLPGVCLWKNQRVDYMTLDMIQDFFKTGRLPNTEAERDPAQEFKLTDTEIDGLSTGEVKAWLGRLSKDALFNRVISGSHAANPGAANSDDEMKNLLKEIARNLSGNLAGDDRSNSSWGTGALASSVTLKPGQKVEVRFTLGWFFPHHTSLDRKALGHMYAHWFNDAAEVNQFLQKNHAAHRKGTEEFARTLSDTSLGKPLAFAWSGQLGTLVTNTWWTRDGHYLIWEGLGCCGLSTTDVDFKGSSSVIALFPELKLGQMKDIIRFQNRLGQMPHNYSYDGNLDHVDPDGYDRVDLNPQFVLMVLRDYLWTGDKDYLNAVYPAIVKAMDYTESLDTDGDGLPDKDCVHQTYDVWNMRGAPSYVASLWIGALRAAVQIAGDIGKASDGDHWRTILDKASASFERVLFNGDYYSLWVDGKMRSEICMTDQVAGEWFTHLMGLPTIMSEKNLARTIDSIWKNNFNPEIGLCNGSVPRGGADILMMDNRQAGGVWSGVEFAFASFLMDRGRYADGVLLVEAVHRRYLRAGMPWNHVECGYHYARAMSSWATLLAATGFKPNLPGQSLIVAPAVSGDFHAPWIMADNFGRIARKDGVLTIDCYAGVLVFQRIQVNALKTKPKVHLGGHVVETKITQDDGLITIEMVQPISIQAGQSCTIG